LNRERSNSKLSLDICRIYLLAVGSSWQLTASKSAKIINSLITEKASREMAQTMNAHMHK
jgi:hypothetical protein